MPDTCMHLSERNAYGKGVAKEGQLPQSADVLTGIISFTIKCTQVSGTVKSCRETVSFALCKDGKNNFVVLRAFVETCFHTKVRMCSICSV